MFQGPLRPALTPLCRAGTGAPHGPPKRWVLILRLLSRTVRTSEKPPVSSVPPRLHSESACA